MVHSDGKPLGILAPDGRILPPVDRQWAIEQSEMDSDAQRISEADRAFYLESVYDPDDEWIHYTEIRYP